MDSSQGTGAAANADVAVQEHPGAQADRERDRAVLRTEADEAVARAEAKLERARQGVEAAKEAVAQAKADRKGLD